MGTEGPPYAPPLPERRPPSSTLASRVADARELVLTALEDARRGEAVRPEVLEEAAKLLYSAPIGDHFLELEDAGWGVEHPEECSEHGDPKQDCEVEIQIREWLHLQNGPPLEPGTYLLRYDDNQRKTKVVRRVERDAGTLSS